mgnify:CR=1 FL=1
MPRFIALPVRQGDAFFLETKEGTVLVDGGRSRQGIESLFREYTKRSKVDILIATHNDADHANGVLGFLESGLKCREIWLPGRWIQVMPHVLRPWEEIVLLIVDQAKQVEKEIHEWISDRSFLEEYADRIGSEIHLEGGDKFDERGWPEQLLSILERVSKEDDLYPLLWEEEVWIMYPLQLMIWKVRKLVSEALLAARRIRKIAIEAFHRGIHVRWLEHDLSYPNGGKFWLYPLNAREVLSIRFLPESQFLKALALTVSNKESLVFWAPPHSAASGVLFTADSDLKGIKLPSLDGAIVTAPHHGSDANKAAYGLISQNYKKPVILVRSDGKFRSRPCNDYLRVCANRFCTLCRNSNRPKQAISFFERNNKWVRNKGVQPCSCR